MLISRFERVLLIFGITLLTLLGLAAVRQGQAAPTAAFTVNSTDVIDDGTCDGTHCSLPEAINAANDAAGPDAIVFSLLPSATITLTGAQLPTITDTLTIDGSTALSLTISGDNLTRTFKIGSGTAVTITTLAIKDGSAVYGGAIYNDGGLLNISNSILSDNSAIFGGGIYNDSGALMVTDSTFSSNLATFTGGGVYNTENTTTTINTSLFSGNRAEVTLAYGAVSGGGIANNGTLTIISSTFANNVAISWDDPNDPSFSAASSGGGITNNGTLTIHSSTFSNNLTFAVAPYNNHNISPNSTPASSSYSAFGGGISNNGTLTVSNSTFSGNMARVALTFNADSFLGSEANGGGISNNGFNSMVTIINSTFSDNSTTIFPFGPGGGGGIDSYGILNLSNSIIANSDDSADCINSGPIVTNINNLIEDGSCAPTLTGDPLLGPLQDNGGPTWTHALMSFSPAVDNGDSPICAAPPVNNLDQRGVTRPLDGNGDGTPKCDIGAYEYDGPPPNRAYLPLLLRN